MSLLNLKPTGKYRAFDEDQCAEAGGRLHADYVSAEPFPHIAIDDFVDLDLLRHISNVYPSRDGKMYFDRAQERLKYQYHPAETDDAATRNLFAELNSQAFLHFLTALTGIEGLIADPYFVGGGLHETCSGGHLGVHADFNIHDSMRVERRLNLLIYLNDDWPEAYGGELELWDTDMSAAVKRIAPLLGRAVIFNTALDSFHGQPDPVRCPDQRSRRSIATYYYTAFELPSGLASRTTNFRVRPTSADRPDRAIGYEHFVRDWVPPRLQKAAFRINPWR